MRRKLIEWLKKVSLMTSEIRINSSPTNRGGNSDTPTKPELELSRLGSAYTDLGRNQVVPLDDKQVGSEFYLNPIMPRLK